MKCETAIAVLQSTFSIKGGFHLPAQIEGVGGERDKTIRVLCVFSCVSFTRYPPSTRWWFFQQSGFFHHFYMCVLQHVLCIETGENNVDWHCTKVNNVDSTVNQATHNTKALDFQTWWNLCNIDAPRVLAVPNWACDTSERVRSSILCVRFMFHDSTTKRSHMVIQTGPVLKFPRS